MMEYKFKRTRIDKFSREKLINELEKTAKHFDYIEFGKRDFAQVANMSAGPVIKEFGSWSGAIDFLREHLKSKKIELKPRKRYFISDKELFDEMERIWKYVGHRPSRTEWESCNPKYTLGPYKTRFNGWQNACMGFIEYKMGKEILIKDNKTIIPDKAKREIREKDKRNIPLKIRLDILKRDNFRCIFCGRSPATDVGVILHLDHIIPYSKGGKSTLDNLQTLCSDCNLGKSNSEL